MHLRDDTGIQLDISMTYTQFEHGLDIAYFLLEYSTWGLLCTSTWITHIWDEYSASNLKLQPRNDTL